MGYRDDRDALRSEVDTLQKELESARDDQQRLAGLEQRLDAARREVNAIEGEGEGELAHARRRPPPRRRALVLAVKGALNGMSMLDADAKQRAGAKAGSWVYEIAYRDRGDRSSTRNQADLDSTAEIGKVWSDNLPEFRVDLAIRPGSAPVEVAVVE